jgi:flagellar basal body-associated protein FliL
MSVEPTDSDKPNMSSDATPTDTGSSLSTTWIIVIVVLVFIIGGIGGIGFFVVQKWKKARTNADVPEGNEVSVPLNEAGSSERASSRQSIEETRV